MSYEIDYRELLADSEDVEDRIIDLFRAFKVLSISMIGIPQTGKTNTAKYLAKLFFNYALERRARPLITYYRFRDTSDLTYYKWLIDRLISYEKRLKRVIGVRHNVFIMILDDLSFLPSTLTKTTKDFLNFLTRIAHKLKWSKRIVLIYVFHYAKAVLPYLRLSQIRIATSITTKLEAESLLDYFNESGVWSYYNFLINNRPTRTKFYSLWNIYGEEHIVRPPRTSLTDLLGDYEQYIYEYDDVYLESFINLRSLYEENENEKTKKRSIDIEDKDLEKLIDGIRKLRELGLIKIVNNKYVYFKADGEKKLISLGAIAHLLS